MTVALDALPGQLPGQQVLFALPPIQKTPFRDAALAVIAELAATRSTFTTDDVWATMPAQGVTHEPRAMGPIMLDACRKQLIEATPAYIPSTRKACNSRPIRVWQSLRYRSRQ